MPSASENKVRRAYNDWRRVVDRRDSFMDEHSDVFNEFEDIVDEINRKRDRLERVCREEETGIGPITVSHQTRVKFDGRLLWNLFADDPESRNELVKVEYKVQRPVFERYVQDGRIKMKDAEKAVLERRRSPALKGVPERMLLT